MIVYRCKYCGNVLMVIDGSTIIVAVDRDQYKAYRACEVAKFPWYCPWCGRKIEAPECIRGNIIVKLLRREHVYRVVQELDGKIVDASKGVQGVHGGHARG